MSSIRLLEIPCTHGSSNVGPSALWCAGESPSLTLSGIRRRYAGMPVLKMKICVPYPRVKELFFSLLGTDPGCSNYDEFYKAAGNFLYGRVLQPQPVDIVMCWGISITDPKWYPAMIRGHACAEDENLRSLSQSERTILLVARHRSWMFKLR